MHMRVYFVFSACILTLCTAQVIGQTVTHGPVLGRLSHDGIGVWVRTSAPTEFEVRLTPAGGGTPVTARGTTHLERDITGWVRVSGLRQNTAYDYTVHIPASGATVEGGRFTTLPHGDAYRNAGHNPAGLFNFAFEFACGNAQGNDVERNDMPTFRTMLEQLHGRIYFQVMNGDFTYETGREVTPAQWQERNRIPDSRLPAIVRLAPAITGVWENYKIYYDRSAHFRTWYRNVPAFFVIDDHEILNDVYGTGTPGVRHRRTVFRDIGVQGWRDYAAWSNPVDDAQYQEIHFGRARVRAGSDILEDSVSDFTALDFSITGTLHIHWGTPDAGVNTPDLDVAEGHPAAGVYEVKEVLDPHRLRIAPAPKADGDGLAYSIGMQNFCRMRVANCEFYLLDTRSHRQMHDVKDPWKRGLSMLGDNQKRWLMECMRNSDADFYFVVSSVNFMIPHVGDKENEDDAWTVFMEEREQLINFWDGLGRPVFVLTGDLHNSFAIKITDRVWEFASGPHNSGNHLVRFECDRPPNGRFSYNGRACDIRWSTYLLNDTAHRRFPHYCVVQVNNVFDNPKTLGESRWVAYPRPQAIFQYYNGLTGALEYAESILAAEQQRF